MAPKLKFIYIFYLIFFSICSKDALNQTNLLERAKLMLENAEKLNFNKFITPHDIINVSFKIFQKKF